jgi:hypothetical protein
MGYLGIKIKYYCNVFGELMLGVVNKYRQFAFDRHKFFVNFITTWTVRYQSSRNTGVSSFIGLIYLNKKPLLRESFAYRLYLLGLHFTLTSAVNIPFASQEVKTKLLTSSSPVEKGLSPQGTVPDFERRRGVSSPVDIVPAKGIFILFVRKAFPRDASSPVKERRFEKRGSGVSTINVHAYGVGVGPRETRSTRLPQKLERLPKEIASYSLLLSGVTIIAIINIAIIIIAANVLPNVVSLAKNITSASQPPADIWPSAIKIFATFSLLPLVKNSLVLFISIITVYFSVKHFLEIAEKIPFGTDIHG